MKPLRDKDYLNQVRALPCCACMQDRSDIHRDVHHLMRGVVRGTALKAPDNWVVPLCHTHHNASKDSVHLSGMEERDSLAGFPDGWTDGLSEAARAKVYGNAVVRPVARYFARAIKEAETVIT